MKKDNDKNFRIVEIIDSKTVIINAGTNNGVQEGTKFKIYESGKEIIDPVTKKSLGKLDIVKETVEAINVYEKMCLCRHIINSGYFTNITNPLLSMFSTEEKILNIDTKDISGGYNTSPIKIGDKVEMIERIETDNNNESTKN